MKKLILILFVMIIIIFFVCLFKENNDTQTGNEWFNNQCEYLNELSILTESIDSVTTLYITNSISQSDFLNHLSTFEKEYIILKKMREEDLLNKPVELGSHSYYSKLGVESAESAYLKVEELIKYIKTNYSNVEELSYAYLAYKQAIAKELSIFKIIYYIINDLGEDYE